MYICSEYWLSIALLITNIRQEKQSPTLKGQYLLTSLSAAVSYLGLVRWWSTSSSAWPCWRMRWTDRVIVVVL